MESDVAKRKAPEDLKQEYRAEAMAKQKACMKLLENEPHLWWAAKHFLQPMPNKKAKAIVAESELRIQYEVHGYKVLRRSGKSWLAVVKYFLKRKVAKLGLFLFC